MEKAYNYSEEESKTYDQRAAEGGWSGPDIVFGLSYEFINQGQTLLDLGIGTGLSSALFHRAGLKISGLDGSPGILEVCNESGFVSDVKCHDLKKTPFPYSDSSFDHTISVGVLNMFGDLNPIFAEASRVISKHGIFAFTVEDSQDGENSSYEHTSRGSGNVISMYRHCESYISSTLKDTGFSPVKRVEFWPFREAYRVFGIFAAYVAQKK